MRFDENWGAGLLKLSSVYSAKKISGIEDLTEGGGTSEHNVYLVWKNLLGRFKRSAIPRVEESIR